MIRKKIQGALVFIEIFFVFLSSKFSVPGKKAYKKFAEHCSYNVFQCLQNYFLYMRLQNIIIYNPG